MILPAGAKVPFHDHKSRLELDDLEHKNGWGFGYSKREPFDTSKRSFMPSPDRYHGSWSTSFREQKDFKKCTFGESYEKLRPRVEMENTKIHTQITFERVGPQSYTPALQLSKKNSSAYSFRSKLPIIEDL